MKTNTKSIKLDIIGWGNLSQGISEKKSQSIYNSHIQQEQYNLYISAFV